MANPKKPAAEAKAEEPQVSPEAAETPVGETPAAEVPEKVEVKPKARRAPRAEAVETQPGLFPEEEILYTLKLGSVDVPVVEDGKGFFKNITQANWNLDHQRSLLRYWREQKEAHNGFDIEAKMRKLFILE